MSSVQVQQTSPTTATTEQKSSVSNVQETLLKVGNNVLDTVNSVLSTVGVKINNFATLVMYLAIIFVVVFMFGNAINTALCGSSGSGFIKSVVDGVGHLGDNVLNEVKSLSDTLGTTSATSPLMDVVSNFRR